MLFLSKFNVYATIHLIIHESPYKIQKVVIVQKFVVLRNTIVQKSKL